MALNLFAIPPHVPFLDALAADWLARETDPLKRADGIILLPTKRSARSLAEAFLRLSDGAPLLLPRITALGALDEAPLTLTGALDLPPAVEPMQRLSALTCLILAMNGANGAPTGADRAWLLAQELATLMDEAERAEIDLALRLPDAADPAFAQHWAETLKFLHIVTEAWPAWLHENGMMNPAARQIALLNAQAEAWQDDPPPHPVLIAGTTAGVRAVARLLSVVARLPLGRVVFPALDMGLDEEAWVELEESHPQAGLQRLLQGLGATRGDIQPWPASVPSAVPESRFPLLSRALLPAKALSGWRPVPGEPAPALDGLTRLTAPDQQEEAEAIALVLRGALETPGTRAALVTPDRQLANRVAAALLRFGVVADDSAGEPLVDSPPAVFLRLLIRAVADGFAPVPLLALLKHPLTGAGLSRADARHGARVLELACLRGPRPGPGLAGVRRALDRAVSPRMSSAPTVMVREGGPPTTYDTDTIEGVGGPPSRTMTVGGDSPLSTFWTRIEHCLEPVIRVQSAMASDPVDALTAVIAAAERLAATDEAPGPAALWSGEEGEALATRLSEVLAALPGLPDQRRAVLPGLLDAVLQGGVVRDRRALRGREGALHPRVFIWGLLEARLQSVDVMVLGSLTETVWPPAADPGAWLSRPMRKQVGLPSPEEIVGQAAHDFVATACAAREIVLSCPARRDGAPAVPARWLTRLEMFLEGRGMSLPAHPAAGWVRALDLPDGAPQAVRPPRPRPAVGLRPRRLSVTEIETWIRDPYAIYAKHILKLAVLKPLDEATDAADYGSLVHDGMSRFFAKYRERWPANAPAELRSAMNQALGDAGLRPALQAWWQPRLDRIADWVAETEADRRAAAAPVVVQAEVSGRLELSGPAGSFRLTGRADRIEKRRDGTLAILDYKTGTVPSQIQVDRGLAPQLPLEAAMAETGAFGADIAGKTAELIYWHLTGGATPAEEKRLFKGDAEATQAGAEDALLRLRVLIASYDTPERPYLSHPNPAEAPRFSDYAQLARVAEWLAAGEEE
jgi:ATP-dependent helicase/nuclease subunit B